MIPARCAWCSARPRTWLGTKGYDPAFGARPMACLVETSIKKPLAEALLFGEFEAGGVAHVDVADDKLALTFSKGDA